MTKVSTITPCYNMSKYLKGWLSNLSAQSHKDLEIILDHNDPSEEEIKWVEEHNKKYNNICHIQVDGVDPIAISMNRCIEFAEGDYLCIWNVDDLRTPDSIESMAKVLDENEDIDIVYGNYTIVSSFGETHGQYVDIEPYIPELKTGMILGPYFMFRKSLLEKSGLFDEQFKTGADYDLALRLVRNGKAHFMSHNLGYYLNEGKGSSTNPNSKQALERTAVELRYGVRILDQSLVQSAKNNYDLDNIIINENEIPVYKFIPEELIIEELVHASKSN